MRRRLAARWGFLRAVVWAVVWAVVCLGCGLEAARPPETEARRGEVEIGIAAGSGILTLTDDELARYLDQLVSIGATWLRIDFDWSQIEPAPGERRWVVPDRVIGSATRRNLHVIGLLTYTPPWARPPNTTDKHPPVDAGEFARFARAAAERYRDRVTVWEVWNEPNSVLFWESGPDPARYAALLAATESALRSADSDVVVLSGGLAPAEDRPGQELSPQRFVQEMYDSLEPGVIDAVAIHPYSFPADPGDSSKEWNLFAQLPELHRLVGDLEGRPLDLWLTEFGAPFDAGDPGRQAEIIRNGLVCVGRWPWTGPVLVYSLRDAATDPDDLAFGLMSPDGTARPAAEAVERFAAVDDDALMTSRCPVGDP